MTSLRIALTLSTLTLLAAPAAAEEPNAAPAPPPKKIAVGEQLEAITAGSFDASVGGESESADFDTTIGIGASVDYFFTPMFSVGFAPRFISGMQPDGFNESADELDLRLRVAAHAEVAPQLEAYGYFALGYSQIRLPDEAQIENPSGLILGAAAGIRYTTPTRLFVGGELGYQFGQQSVEMDGTEAGLDTQFLHLGVTAGVSR